MEIPSIYLQNKAGDHVAEFKAISPVSMKTPPEVMTWGDRSFTFKEKTESGGLIYLECLTYPLVDQITCEQMK